MLKQIFLVVLLSITSLACWALNLKHAPAVNQYLLEVSREYDFDLKQLHDWYRHVQFDHKIYEKMNRAAISYPIPWRVYRKSRVTALRVQRGAEFWHENHTILSKAEKKYGVPASVIVAILGMETNYGQNQGSYEALNSLTTFAFFSPKRRDYFRNELTQFLLLSRDQGWDPLTIKSSYDGGLGMAQFMPDSYRTYAVASHPEKPSDLFHNKQDAINSIGNYLQRKGWRHGQTIAIQAKVISKQQLKRLRHEEGKPHFTLKELHDYGLAPVGKIPKDLPIGVLPLEGDHDMEYWLTFPNFSIIRTYNLSKMYAMAVYQLNKEITHSYYHSKHKK